MSKKSIKILEENFDEMMEHVGWFGTFTIRLYFTMYFLIMWGAMNIAGGVFIAADVSHTCIVNEDLKSEIAKECHINWTIAQSNLTGPEEKSEVSVCTRYSKASLLNTSCLYWSGNGTSSNFSTEDCFSWSYSKAIYSSTIITEFDWVCENQWKKDLFQLVLLLGVLLGALICGIGSDRWGRSRCFLISSIILFVSSFATSFAKVFWLFMLLRIMVGVGSIGMCVSGVVYAMEITSIRHRVVVSQILQASFSFAFMLLALFGYLQRSWFYLNLIISVPIFLLILFYKWFSEESPRWLMSKKKPQAAITVLQHMAHVNNKSLEEFFEKFQDTNPIMPKEEIKEDMPLIEIKYSTLELFKNPVLRTISAILFYNWFAVTCIYYGLTLNTGSLAGNPYLNFFLVALVEIPANFGAIAVIKLWGRRPTICLCNIVCGVSLLSMMLVSKDQPVISIVLYLIGKFGSTATFSCIYLYSAELYPTPLRGNGVGMCSGWARIGSMVSQLIVMLGVIDKTLPFATFGVIALLAGVLILILPETKERPLPENIPDTEHLYKFRNVGLMKQFTPRIFRSFCAPRN